MEPETDTEETATERPSCEHDWRADPEGWKSGATGWQATINAWAEVGGSLIGQSSAAEWEHLTVVCAKCGVQLDRQRKIVPAQDWPKADASETHPIVIAGANNDDKNWLDRLGSFADLKGWWLVAFLTAVALVALVLGAIIGALAW